MRALILMALLVTVLATNIINVHELDVKKDGEEKSIIQLEQQPNNKVQKKKKHKCNLGYLACVKKGGDTRKNRMECGKKFLKCVARCYKKCKFVYKDCRQHHSRKICKKVYKKCAHKCPHYNKCEKQCKAIFIKCEKSKGKHCFPIFVSCLKKCRKPKNNN